MISYWKNTEQFYNDNGLIFITGHYDHKNKNNSAKVLGMHWGDFPQSRGVLSPCVIPKETRNAVLSGLLHQATTNQDEDKIKKIIRAIQFFK